MLDGLILDFSGNDAIVGLAEGNVFARFSGARVTGAANGELDRIVGGAMNDVVRLKGSRVGGTGLDDIGSKSI